MTYNNHNENMPTPSMLKGNPDLEKKKKKKKKKGKRKKTLTIFWRKKYWQEDIGQENLNHDC